MTPAVRKAKAKQLTQLIEQLDIANLVRHRLAIQCLDSEHPKHEQSLAAVASETLQLINTLAYEGKLAYDGRNSKLGEPAK
jgi:hypothetical protein